MLENEKMEQELKNETETKETSLTVKMDDDEKFIAELTNDRKVQYSSLVPKNEEQEIILFNAMNSPKHRISDMIGQVIEVVHVFCEVVKCTNEETGEVSMCPRTVLIDKNGESYQAVSLGVFGALKKIFQIKGAPSTWTKPCKLKVMQVTKGTRKMLTFSMVK